MIVADLPRAGLARVVEELGSTLLDVVCGDVQGSAEIGGVVIHDPLDEPELPEGALVLGVGLHDPAEIAQVVTRLGELGAIGLVVRAPVEATDDLCSAARRAGVTVLALSRGAAWSYLAGMVRTLTAERPELVREEGPVPVGRTGAGLRQVVGYQSGLDDLFAVANAIAALVDAPVTIEDRSSRLLAFSSRQEEVDDWRVQTILRRQVPEQYTRVLEQRGVFREIYRSTRPVWVPPVADDSPDARGRAAIAVRAGDEILGTIWAVAAEPLDEERSQALYDASKMVAMHMVWQRADADLERRMRAELISTALESGPQAAETLRRLGLKDEPAVVLALTVTGAGAEHPLPAQLAVERKRLADAFALHLTAVHPRSAAGLVGDVAYGILPVARGRRDGDERAAEIAGDFLARVDSRLRPIVGVGPLVAGSAALKRSRTGADRALRVLRSRQGGQQVARLDDVHLEALLLELADRVPRGDLPSGAVARIVAYDREHRSSLVDTLRAWLDAFGDVAVAAEAMYVHANTFRYRLRRAAEVGRIDLADPDQRLAAMLQLRLMALTSTPDD